MLERLVVGVQEESRLIPQLNCQDFFLDYLKGKIPDIPDIPRLRRWGGQMMEEGGRGAVIAGMMRK